MEVREVMLDMFEGRCLDCGGIFEIFNFPDFQYGQRILRTAGGEDIALLDCPHDTAMPEVSELIRNEYRGRPLKDSQFAKLFNKVFGVVCDPIDGKTLDASRVGASCPHCKSSNINTYEIVPRVSVAVKVPIVTHKVWEQLAENQKRSLISEKLAQARSTK
jgi:hypothetical protein